MGVKQIAIALACCIPLWLSVACSSKVPYWDRQTSQFHRPDEDIVISLPTDLDWTIADSKDLPENVLFCGVVPDLGLCTFLVSEKCRYNKSDIWLYPDEDIQNLIKKISLQNTMMKVDVRYYDFATEKCRCNSLKAVKFVTKVVIDEYIVNYTGYIFSKRNKLYGIVVMEPDPKSPYIHELAIKSISGFKFTK